MNRRSMQGSCNPANVKLAKGKKIEFKRAEEIIDALGDGLVLVDMDGKITAVNPAMEKMGGYSKSEVAGKDAADVISKVIKPEDMEKIMRALGTTLEGKSPLPGTSTLVTKDGREIPIAFIASFLKDAEGKPTAIVAMIKDITELKRAEEALRESEGRYRTIFEQAADSVVLIDAETGALVEFNDMAHENLGYTCEEFAKLKIPDFEVIESAEEVAKHIEKIIKEGADTFETKHRTKGGEIRDIQVKSRAISICGKDFVQSIWRDITERKKVEEERLKAAADRQRIEELERFAKVAVGRELKMVELKERIKELESKLEEITGKE